MCCIRACGIYMRIIYMVVGVMQVVVVVEHHACICNNEKWWYSGSCKCSCTMYIIYFVRLWGEGGDGGLHCTCVAYEAFVMLASADFCLS